MENTLKETVDAKSSKHDLIEKFCLENEVEDMHLRMYLQEKGIVSVTQSEYDELK